MWLDSDLRLCINRLWHHSRLIHPYASTPRTALVGWVWASPVPGPTTQAGPSSFAGVAPSALTFSQLIIFFSSATYHLSTYFDARKLSRSLIWYFLFLYSCILFLYAPSCLNRAASFLSRCTSRMVWPSLEEPLRNIAPPVTRLSFWICYLKVLSCSRLLEILS